MLKYFETDIVLVEGFKRENTFPKIACLRDETEKETLLDGPVLFTASFNHEIADFDILNGGHVQTMAAAALEKAFKLPNLNCAQCGYETCADLARAIVKGGASVDQCKSLNPPISVKVEGKSYPLNHYTSNLFRNLLQAMVSSLKGAKKGKIEIEIP